MAATPKHDARFMQEALRLARRGIGRVEPNPMVGCILVRGGRTIGQGYHRRFGGPHAEVEALADCRRRGIDPAGATAYVTLEPCCHHGKTPPCTKALIEAKVASVCIATQDPFPKVAGKGIMQLCESDIHVELGVCEAQARRLNEPFFKCVSEGIPFVIAKWAQTVDGQIASVTGDSKWISNTRSRKRVHQLRGRVDAIVVGIGTVLADDPLLTARDVPVHRIARRVVVDPDLRIPIQSKLLQSLRDPDPAPLTIALHERVLYARAPKLQDLEKLGVEFIGLPPSPEDGSKAMLRPLLVHLHRQHAATNVLVEGGARLLGSLLAQSLVDMVKVYIAPKLLGQDRGLSAVGGVPGRTMQDALRLELRSTKRLGSDIVLDYRVPKASAAEPAEQAERT